ncbi:MAG: orotate phosphoribosyltransferase [Muribaculaceae bacterium]|nr:orotate phosphoribosyltransferase [Muribaculaceae bacterium]
MEQVARLLAGKLLQISAINLQPDNSFIWANGWNAPIYTDMRKSLSYPALRTFIKIQLARLIMELFGEAEAVAGVATGAIAYSAMVADELGLPYAYVRTTPKDHGLENLIEGNLKPGMKVVIVNDLISNGNRSLSVAQTLRDAGCDVVGIVAMLDFDFEDAACRLDEMGIPFKALSHFGDILREALQEGFIRQSDVTALNEWHDDPESWTPGDNDNE